MADQLADRYPDSEGPFAGPNNTFPLNTAGRVRNAWARIHQGPTMGNHSAAEIAGIKTKIKARAKELGIMLEDQTAGASRSLGIDNLEQRNTLGIVELRSMDRSSREIGGFAALFNVESRQMGQQRTGAPYVEILNTSAFNKSHADCWPGLGGGVACRYEHDNFHMLGSTKSGTLRLGISDIGLEYSVDCPETRQDVFELIARGDVTQSSFAMIVVADDWSTNEAGYAQRNVIETKLIDVAPVITPAYVDTTVGLRSLARFKNVPFEDVLAKAAKEELRSFFVRTDLDGSVHKRTRSGRSARNYMYGKRPDDPFSQAG
jgi:hypothetical protein